MKFFKFFFLLVVATKLFVGESAFSQTEFVENKGQWDKQVKFMTNAGNGAFFLQNKGFTIVQHNPGDLDAIVHGHNKADKVAAALQKTIRSHAYAVQFVGANENPEIIPDKPLPSVNNYFIGNDKSKWVSDCKIYGGVTYKNVYPGIDVRYYADGGTQLKYDIIVHPGGDINKIALQYKGANGLSIKNKELIIKTSLGENKELYPYTYQLVNNQRTEVETRYELKGDIVKFRVKDHSPSKTLVIDPSLVFFTYSGSKVDNWGFTATYGPDGSFYSGGIAFGTGFPVSPGAFQTNYGGGSGEQGRDISIMKLSPDGVNRRYATYIGGSGNEQPHSLIVDAQGNLILAGRTDSPNYPVSSGSQAPGGLMDIIVTKLNAAGNAIIGSMRIGGSGNDGVNISDQDKGTTSLQRYYGDDARSEVIIDGAGNIYVASSTQSGNFPTTAGALQRTFGGKQDGVVIKLNPACNSIMWSTFLGGSENDAAYVLVLGNNNNVYVAGGTASNNIPSISSSGVVQSSNMGGDCDGFVIELTNNGANAIKGTYLGTTEADQVYGIQTDKAGNIYVMGTTEGSWPVINAAYSNAGSKQFISKIDPNLSGYIYSTIFGSINSSLPNISPTAFLVDRCENVYVSGWGGKASTSQGYKSATTKGMPVTADAIKGTTDPSGSDFYFIVIKKDAASLLFATFYGENNPVSDTNPINFGDHVDGGTSRFDQRGFIYQAMCANCGGGLTFLGTPGTWSTNNQAKGSSSGCNVGMLKIEMGFAGVEAAPQASINGVVNDTAGCVPLTVNFTDTLQKGKRFIWDYGDGSKKDTLTSFNTSHTYNAIGTFLVTLIAIDSTTCNISDTAYLTIRVGANKADLNFIPNKTGLCTDLSYLFTNTSTASSGSFKANSFTWDFGDGSPRVTAGTSPVAHTYAGPGTYIVKLILTDTAFCNAPDSTSKTVRLSPQVKAQFNTPPQGCVPYNAVFENTSAGGLNFLWDFGDGTTSTADNPTHLYTAVGSYTVKLYAFDSTSCNKLDSTSFVITVVSIPTAAFTHSPVPPQENTPVQFTNQSIGATSYLWYFGDGDSSTEIHPRHLFNATGTYDVCLIAINSAGCSDTICLPVNALIIPLLDVPTGFTPGKFGVNSVVSVKGFGIKEMQWSIYNRWGQKVFESTNPSNGWDGYYKGKLQQMDVYTYTLDVIFSDGTKTRKTGDITLIK